MATDVCDALLWKTVWKVGDRNKLDGLLFSYEVYTISKLPKKQEENSVLDKFSAWQQL